LQEIWFCLSSYQLSFIFIYGLIFFRWYLALAFAIVTFFVIIPIFKVLLPKVESNFYLGRIRGNLGRKQETFRTHNDALRELVVTNLITRFDSSFKELKGGDPNNARGQGSKSGTTIT